MPTLNREQWLTRAFRLVVLHDMNPTSPTYRMLDDRLERVAVLPSFPNRTTRTGAVLHDRQTTTDARTVLAVAPTLAENAEVVAVLDYMATRWRSETSYNPARPSSWERARLAANGYGPRYDQVIPGPEALARITDTTAAVVEALGDYPAEAVSTAVRRPQTSRMLRLVCNGPARSTGATHDPYILRMSQTQLDRGAPLCGICHARLAVQ